ncbi:MAG TPA: transposase, partial [Kofleriaceae bacterium]|nr:transposase [Kofleriaceae bacterium]
MTDSAWDDHAVRLVAARYALAQMTQLALPWAWIIDDTGFLKQGTHSVGVQRQYTGSAGKIANCQVGVSLSIATPQDHVAVDFELYLPTSWANDTARRAEARIP